MSHGLGPLVSFIPVIAYANIDLQRDTQHGSTAHQLPHLFFHPFHFIDSDFEHQFVMDLHDHARLRATLLQPSINGDHGALDDIGGGSLHWRIDGRTLGILSALCITRLDILYVETAPEYGLHITLLPRQF